MLDTYLPDAAETTPAVPEPVPVVQFAVSHTLWVNARVTALLAVVALRTSRRDQFAYAHVVPQSQRDAVDGLASAISSGQLLIEQRIADSAEGKSFVS